MTKSVKKGMINKWKPTKKTDKGSGKLQEITNECRIKTMTRSMKKIIKNEWQLKTMSYDPWKRELQMKVS